MSKAEFQFAYHEAHLEKDLEIFKRALFEIRYLNCIEGLGETKFAHDIQGQGGIGEAQIDGFACLGGIIEACTQRIDNVLNERGKIVD